MRSAEREGHAHGSAWEEHHDAEMLELVEEMSQVGTMRFDLLRRTSRCSPVVRHIFEHTSSEPPADIDAFIARFSERQQPMIREAIVRAVSETGTFQFEDSLSVPGGRTKCVEVRGRVLAGEGGPQMIIAVLRDVSELRHREKSLRDARLQAIEANRVKSQFLANMSHEIRTPMNGVLGMAELLASTNLNAEQKDYLRHIQSSGATLVAIINDILDLSKIEAGQMTLESTRICIEKIVTDVALSLAPIAQRKDLELIVRIAPNLPRAHLGDPVRIRQILVNLLGNAIKFTKSGEVEIGADTDDSGVVLTVVDTGVGISESRIQSVFEAFTQEDTSTTRQFGGTGLGLTIVASLTERMNGSIDVQSQVNEGSRFTVSLPLDVADPTSDNHDEHFDREVIVNLDNQRTEEVVAEMLAHFRCTVSRKRPDDPSALRDSIWISEQHCPETSELIHDSVLLVTPLDLGEQASIKGRHLRKPVLRDGLLSLLRGNDTKLEDASPLSPLGPTFLGSGAPARSLNILLAEDNPVSAKVALLVLSKLGHTITHAENGALAVRAWQEGQFDLILMDVHMPEVDGFIATRQIRELEGETEDPIFIIALTANAMRGDHERCLNAGMDAYLAKPLNVDQLKKTLDRLQRTTT